MQTTIETLPANHPDVPRKTGVLLVNLGTPQSTGWWEIRRYLRQFLSDRRVIEVPRLLWFFILNLIILTFRPAKTAHAYKKIWRKESNESPLRYYTRQQAEKLQQRFGDNLVVDWAMRYGQPAIASRIQHLQNIGCDKVVLMPLYPQYAASTTATVCDDAFQSLMAMRWQPTLRVVDSFESHPLYIKALVDTTMATLSTLDWQPEAIMVSFHGIPERYFTSGDPYPCFCRVTFRHYAEAMATTGIPCKMTFQSRFGREPWVEPYTDETLARLPKEDVQNLLVICPGFVSDCVETLEEIAIAGQEIFKESGGKNYAVVPCLNDGMGMIDLLEDLTRQTAGNWLQATSAP